MTDSQQVSIDGHQVRLTNLDKVLYPATGTTKGDVIKYYTAISKHMLPYCADRPATRKRWVHGVGTNEEPGQVFFQKNLDASTPDWVHRATITHKSHVIDYPLVNNTATLVWLAQIAALEIHVPQWHTAAGTHINLTGLAPDRMVLDLDPGPGAGLPECVEVAHLCRNVLTGMGLDPFPVTSGSKGIHLYAPLDGTRTSEEISAVAHELARALEADHPDLVVSDMKKELRKGKVLLDWSQNNAAKTTIAPYSLRGREHPTVAAPRDWSELTPDIEHLDLNQVLQRVRAQATTADKLDRYRAKRDPQRTPEPFDTPARPEDEPPRFVIQEHHARRLHYDFRLEHDGVLVSWALPKGVPTDAKKNHLAVQTEDHPLSYGNFEGTIPKGEYGAGTVTIWDTGTYELHKWRPGSEVIATLHGRPDGGLAERGGSVQVALIHTGEADNWLIHLMQSGLTMPTPPMLATLATQHDITEPHQWALEMKWDGIRALIDTRAGIRVWTRNGNDVTSTYPELQQLADHIHVPAVIDAEIVALRNGHPDFGLLQERFGLTTEREIARARAHAPVDLIVFDILEADGRELTNQTYTTRREALELVFTPAGRFHLSETIDLPLSQALKVSADLNLEGIMAKRRDSTYRTGRRSRDWLKIKHTLQQEVVIVGWRHGRGALEGTISSLLVAVPGPNGKLFYAGRVGSGLTDTSRNRLLGQFVATEVQPVDPIPAADARDATWVEPTVVGEVQFQEWTAEGKLRQPVWRGIRPDKTPADVVGPA